MARNSRWVFLGLVGLLLAADKASDDLDRLQGTWKVVSGESRGKPAPEDAVKNLKWVIHGNKITSQGGGGKAFEITFRLDPSQDPPAIDFTNPERKQTIQGIYKLADGTLTLCLGAPGESKPKKFATAGTLKTVILVLKKERAE